MKQVEAEKLANEIADANENNYVMMEEGDNKDWTILVVDHGRQVEKQAWKRISSRAEWEKVKGKYSGNK